MAKDRVAVIDVETTGLSPWRHDRIVEIGVVVIDSSGSIECEYETLVNPSRDIGPSSIHRIRSADVLRAPGFADIAGDILELISNCTIVAGHNVSFDRNFLVKEYERLGVFLPDFPMLCTCRLFGRASLRSCCDELGIPCNGTFHRALVDAKLTSQIVAALCSGDPSLLDSFRIPSITWPKVDPLRTPCFTRTHAERLSTETPRFLQRLSTTIHHNTEAESPNVLAYMVLIDRILEDRIIDENEEDVLVNAVVSLGISSTQLDAAHAHYIRSLAVAALADGVVSDAERRDLHSVARLLGQSTATLDGMLELAALQLATARSVRHGLVSDASLTGKSVCFTGELSSTIGGEPISRDLAEKLAEDAGLSVMSNVTKKLDLLVVSDPNTQSGKAKKARSYGTRILAEAVFWRMAGVAID
jgi:DNA polymerase-3 subunit epsilon